MKRSLPGFLILFCASGFAQSWDSIPRLVEHYKRKTEQFAREQTTHGKIIFLGNSITEGGDWGKLLEDSTVINRGIGGDITFGILKRLDEVVRFQPSKLFLSIGINDLSKGIPEDVVLENIFGIVAEVKRKSPLTYVFVQSIFPVNPTFKNFPKGYDLRERIAVINAQLGKIASRFGYTYIDLYKGFTDAEGLLDKKLSTDGLHLNAAGYQHWVRILKEGKYL